MQTTLLTITVLALFGYAQAQVQSPGPCPNVQLQTDFDLAAYMGTWYEYAKYPVFYEGDDKCVKGVLTLRDDGNVGVVNSGVNNTTNEPGASVGYALVDGPAKLKIIFPSSRPTNETSNYWVLGTDYLNYSVVYFCRTAGENVHNTVAWILARQQHPSSEYVDIAKNIFIQNGVSLDELVVTNQNDCEAAINDES